MKIFLYNPRSVADVTLLFIGDDSFEEIMLKTNRYHNTNNHRYKNPAYGSKLDVTVLEIKKAFVLIIIVNLVRKNKIHNYWCTNPLIATLVCSNTLSRDRFLQICTFLHFSNITVVHVNKDKLIKAQKIIDYFINKFRSVCEP
ncbi:PiggyBac transposable element-derived protein 4, partial [Anthophora retusa]